MLFAVKMGIVFYNSFFQRLLASTGVEFAKGFRIKDVTANVFHKQKELPWEFFCGPTCPDSHRGNQAPTELYR
jgi:hypothetical protein